MRLRRISGHQQEGCPQFARQRHRRRARKSAVLSNCTSCLSTASCSTPGLATDGSIICASYAQPSESDTQLRAPAGYRAAQRRPATPGFARRSRRSRGRSRAPRRSSRSRTRPALYRRSGRPRQGHRGPLSIDADLAGRAEVHQIRDRRGIHRDQRGDANQHECVRIETRRGDRGRGHPGEKVQDRGLLDRGVTRRCWHDALLSLGGRPLYRSSDPTPRPSSPHPADCVNRALGPGLGIGGLIRRDGHCE